MAYHSGNTIHRTPSVEEELAFVPSLQEANHQDECGEQSLSLLDLPATLDENTKRIRRDTGDSHRPTEYLSNSGPSCESSFSSNLEATAQGETTKTFLSSDRPTQFLGGSGDFSYRPSPNNRKITPSDGSSSSFLSAKNAYAFERSEKIRFEVCRVPAVVEKESEQENDEMSDRGSDNDKGSTKNSSSISTENEEKLKSQTASLASLNEVSVDENAKQSTGDEITSRESRVSRTPKPIGPVYLPKNPPRGKIATRGRRRQRTPPRIVRANSPSPKEDYKHHGKLSSFGHHKGGKADESSNTAETFEMSFNHSLDISY